MTSDYVDNWDVLPARVQDVLIPIVAEFEAAADLLFDRRLNLSFEAAVKDLSIPGVVALTQGLRGLRDLLQLRVTVEDAGAGRLLFDQTVPLTAYDLPLYMPAVYLSQLAQYMDGQNVRVWKGVTALEIADALHDMAYLYPETLGQLEEAASAGASSNAAHIATQAARLAQKNALAAP